MVTFTDWCRSVDRLLVADGFPKAHPSLLDGLRVFYSHGVSPVQAARLLMNPPEITEPLTEQDLEEDAKQVFGDLLITETPDDWLKI